MFEPENSRPPKIHITQHQPHTQRDRLGSLLEDVARNRQTKPRNRWLWLAAIAAGLLAVIVGFLFIRSQLQLRELQKDLRAQAEQRQNDPAVQRAAEARQLIDQVRKLIILPDDEEPTIATVNDLSKLQGQPFFAKAQIGDKVLIYNKARKAILFRPSENKIIELAPLVGGSASTPGSPATPASGSGS